LLGLGIYGVMYLELRDGKEGYPMECGEFK